MDLTAVLMTHLFRCTCSCLFSHTVSSRMHFYCYCYSRCIMQHHSWKFSLPSMYFSPFLLYCY